MRVFTIRTLGNLADPELCVLDKAPDGIGVKYSRLVDGRSVAAEFPREATLRMSPDRTGLKLGSLVGNTKRFLIVHRDARDVIATACEPHRTRWPVEYLPFTLINHKGQPHSADYVFVNPLGSADCVDPGASEIVYFNDNPSMVLDVKRLVLDAKKVAEAPPLFRIPQAPDRYFVKDSLHVELSASRFNNFVFDEVELKAPNG